MRSSFAYMVRDPGLPKNTNIPGEPKHYDLPRSAVQWCDMAMISRHAHDSDDDASFRLGRNKLLRHVDWYPSPGSYQPSGTLHPINAPHLIGRRHHGVTDSWYECDRHDGSCMLPASRLLYVCIVDSLPLLIGQSISPHLIRLITVARYSMISSAQTCWSLPFIMATPEVLRYINPWRGDQTLSQTIIFPRHLYEERRAALRA